MPVFVVDDFEASGWYARSVEQHAEATCEWFDVNFGGAEACPDVGCVSAFVAVIRERCFDGCSLVDRPAPRNRTGAHPTRALPGVGHGFLRLVTVRGYPKS